MTAKKKRTIRTIPQERAPVSEQPPAIRARNFAEVTHRFEVVDALHESDRCLSCPEQPCVSGCPVSIDIPNFIAKINTKDYRGAYDVISETNLLPAICGRVCPQESQCEGRCIVGDNGSPRSPSASSSALSATSPLRKAGRCRRSFRRTASASASSAPARPAWPAPPTWPRRAATSPSMRRSTCPAACCATASRNSACPIR